MEIQPILKEMKSKDNMNINLLTLLICKFTFLYNLNISAQILTKGDSANLYLYGKTSVIVVFDTLFHEINKTDSNGNKTGLWVMNSKKYKIYLDDSTISIVKLYKSGKQKRYKGYLNGRKFVDYINFNFFGKNRLVYFKRYKKPNFPFG